MDGIIDLAGVIRESIVDGPGLRFVVFTQGCPHHCPGCQNPHTHTFGQGTPTPVSKIMDEIKKNPLLSGVTLSGGEPFCQADALAELATQVKAMGKNVMIYSGYTLEQLMEKQKQEASILHLLKQTDWLVDGPFILEKKSLELKFRGSSNQRIIDIPHFLQTKEIREVDLVPQYSPEFQHPL